MNRKLRVGDREVYWFVAIWGLVDLCLQIYFRDEGVGVLNTGFSFGLGSGRGESLIFLVMLLLIFGWRFYFKEMSYGLFAVLVGGSVNFLMRVGAGGVWDYLCWSWLPFKNNLSDILITLGVILLIWQEVKK